MINFTTKMMTEKIRLEDHAINVFHTFLPLSENQINVREITTIFTQLTSSILTFLISTFPSTSSQLISLAYESLSETNYQTTTCSKHFMVDERLARKKVLTNNDFNLHLLILANGQWEFN